MKNTWKVNGLVFRTGPQKRHGVAQKKLSVRYSDDERGKTLSIADENSGVMFVIQFEEILKDITKDGGKAS